MKSMCSNYTKHSKQQNSYVADRPAVFEYVDILTLSK